MAAPLHHHSLPLPQKHSPPYQLQETPGVIERRFCYVVSHLCCSWPRPYFLSTLSPSSSLFEINRTKLPVVHHGLQGACIRGNLIRSADYVRRGTLHPRPIPELAACCSPLFHVSCAPQTVSTPRWPASFQQGILLPLAALWRSRPGA